MNLAKVPKLTVFGESGTWFRAINPRVLPSALSTAHTPSIASRFSPGTLASTPFEILYLAENHLVALFEVKALFGSPTRPGGLVPNPAGPWTVINATVQLTAVHDLSDLKEQTTVGTNVQELTVVCRGSGRPAAHLKLVGYGNDKSMP